MLFLFLLPLMLVNKDYQCNSPPINSYSVSVSVLLYGTLLCGFNAAFKQSISFFVEDSVFLCI